jgi:uncharacterized protein YecE (DUF72 family)
VENLNELRIGPAGWAYTDWQGVVYPSPRPHDFHEPAYLAQYFDTIEINTSFYQPISPALAEQWIEQIGANPRFQFTAKVWQKFTHEMETTAADESAVRAGIDVLRAANCLGAMLVQFPFSFHKTPENVARLERLADSFRDYPLVLEVRHSSWDDSKIHAMLRHRKVGLVNIDQPLIGRAVRPSEYATASVAYFRLHGRRYDTWFTDDPTVPRHERYNYLYSEEELKPWAERIQRVATRAKSTFVIMNNHYAGKGVVNALDLLYLLGHQKVKVPEPLRQYYPRLDKIADQPAIQGRLFRSRG